MFEVDDTASSEELQPGKDLMENRQDRNKGMDCLAAGCDSDSDSDSNSNSNSDSDSNSNSNSNSNSDSGSNSNSNSDSDSVIRTCT